MKKKIFIQSFFFFIIFFFLEIFILYGHFIFPYEDHARYQHTKNIKLIISSSTLKKINGRSAIGELFNRQKKQVAFFGTSSLFDGVSMYKTWPALFGKSTNNMVHVDNFAFFGETVETLLKKLHNLCLLQRYYDISVIQLSHTGIGEEYYTPGYHDIIKPHKTKFPRIYQKIEKWYNRTQTENLFLKKLMKNNNFNEVAVREKQQNVFIKHSVEVDKKQVERVVYLIPKIVKKAYCISKKVFWLTEPFAWSENMLDSYEKIYIHLERVKKEDSDTLLFADNESLGLYMMKQKQIITEIVKKENIIFIDLFDSFQKEISKTPNLFIDESHLSEKGHQFAFEIIHPFFLKHISEK